MLLAEDAKSKVLLVLVSALVPILGVLFAFLVWIRRRTWRLALVLLAASALGAAAYVYLYDRFSDKSQTQVQPSTAYSYKNLSSHNFSGPKSGVGVRLNKPVEFKLSTDGSSDVRQIFGHTVPREPSYYGGLSLLSAPYPATEKDKIVAQANDSFKQDVSSPAYRQASLPVRVVLEQWLPEDYSVELSKAQAFTSNAIKSNSWQFDFTATHTKNNKLPELQGKAIYSVGQNGVYIIGMAAIRSNWQANEAIFQTVLNSLEVDL